MTPDQLIELLNSHKPFRKKITHIEIIPPHKPHHCKIDNLHPLLQNYLNDNNITPYLHQCQTFKLIKQGKNVIITTPTASGKTLAYNLPIFEHLILNSKARALYIYPTKALTNDQLLTIKKLQKHLGISFKPAIYDGDISSQAKSIARSQSRIILTNPYELHQILPWRHQWTNFLSNLDFVVIDEAHRYRGVFGSNVAFVIRRLRRLTSAFNKNPQFILSSATLANSVEFANKLTGLNFELVENDGSPKGKKYFVFYNPYNQPKDNKEDKHQQVSVVDQTAKLIATFVWSGIKTLTFTRSRKMAELIAKRSREILQRKKYSNLAAKITSYRAGYLPTQRRKIEKQLKEGQLLALTSTNALELGIDIGHLDAVIITGFPGTKISTMQQAGRAGRKGKTSVAVLVAYQDKLDQYFMENPNEFFERSYEHAIVDLSNPYIASGHLLCAAAELPLNEQDKNFFDQEILDKTIKAYIDKGLLKKTAKGFIYTGKISPVQVVSLDNISADQYKIIWQNQLLEVINQIQAFKEAHQGAVFLHQGETFIVKNFDLEKKLITVEKKDVNYYTQPLKTVNAWIISTLEEKKFNDITLYLGKLQISEQYTGYKIKHGDQVVGYGELDLPPVEFQTIGLWFTMPGSLEKQIIQLHKTKTPAYPSFLKNFDTYNVHKDLFAAGLHGVEHAMIGIMPFLVMADRWDIGGFSTIFHQETGLPTIFIYDGYPAGIGLSQKGFTLFEKLTQMTANLVKNCKCKDGCPACIMSPKCGNDNRPLDKQASIIILDYLLKNIGKP